MDRLSIYLTLMTGAVLTGGLVIVAFTLNWYTWPVIIGAAVLGFGLSWPVAYMISRRIKRQDGDWDETAKDDAGLIPKPGAPEV